MPSLQTGVKPYTQEHDARRRLCCSAKDPFPCLCPGIRMPGIPALSVWACRGGSGPCRPFMRIAGRLCQLHDALYARFRPGDRLVYTGNYTGFGPKPIETIDEILGFRRSILSISGVLASDVVYLRDAGGNGAKAASASIRAQPVRCFALDARKRNGRNAVGLWIFGAGWGRSARVGVVALTHWTVRIHKAIWAHAGHDF